MAVWIDKGANQNLRRNIDFQRMSVFIEAKRKLNRRLMKLPDGNLEKLAKLASDTVYRTVGPKGYSDR